jgi:predicted nucleotidyltransferase
LASEDDIQDFAKEVREAVGGRAEQVYLFGSYAMDEHVPGSIIDLMVLLSEMDEEAERDIWKIADKFFRNRDLHFTPKIYAKSDFEDKVEKGYSFYSEVAQEGVEI